LRVLYALTLADDHNLPVAIGDRFFFVEGARLLADGHGFVHPFVWLSTHHGAASAGHPPLWTIALAPFAKVGLDGYDAARLVGAVAGAAVVVAVGAVGRRLAGARAGLIAAGLAAVYLPFVVSDTSGMSEALYLVLVALTVLAVLSARESARAPLAVAAGVAAGLAALTRTEGLLLVPLLAWPALWGRGGARSWALPLATTLAAALVIAPWTVRNAIALDRFVLVSTNESTVLAGANCDATYHGRDTGSWRPDCLARATGPFSLDSYDEGVLAARWSGAGRRYARHHVGRLAVVLPVRVLRTWRLWQPGREGRLSEGENADVTKAGGFVFLFLILPGALLAVLLARLRREALLVLGALAAMVTLTSAAGWGAPRFLRPAELALLVAAGAGIDVLLRRRASPR
jgi:4-amino-4-deoxy-L-arabinose transferase-like glycosyltransferase